MNTNWRAVCKRIGSSIWFIPFVAIPLELIAVRIVHYLDDRLKWPLLGLGSSGATAMLEAIVSANLAFLVFTFGSLLVAIQVASAQLTPRIIATTLLSDRTIKYCVGIFVFTLLFAVGAQNRMEGEVRQLVVFTAALFGIICFAAFFFLIDHASRLLRPVSVLSQVASAGLDVIDKVYPEESKGPEFADGKRGVLGEPNAVITHREKSGIVLSVNAPAVLAEASRANVVIEFVPQVGDFLATDESLFLVYHQGRVDERMLRNAVVFGSEIHSFGPDE